MDERTNMEALARDVRRQHAAMQTLAWTAGHLGRCPEHLPLAGECDWYDVHAARAGLTAAAHSPAGREAIAEAIAVAEAAYHLHRGAFMLETERRLAVAMLMPVAEAGPGKYRGASGMSYRADRQGRCMECDRRRYVWKAKDFGPVGMARCPRHPSRVLHQTTRHLDAPVELVLLSTFMARVRVPAAEA